MKGQKKHLMPRVIMGVLILMLLNLNLTGIMWYNHTDISFQESAGKGSCPSEKSIRDYILKGAECFGGSYSSFLFFLKKIEEAERKYPDYNELRKVFNAAVEKMRQTRNVYKQLKQRSEVTPYNPVIIDKLSNFDYDTFSKKEKVTKSIFKQVEAFLNEGKIREMYGEALSHTEHILCMANAVSKKLEDDIFPGVPSLHALNQAYDRYMRFGKYAARVFEEIN